MPFIGRAEYRESLKTADIEVARTYAALRDAEVALEFEAARAKRGAQDAPKPRLPDSLSPDATHYIREAVRTQVLQEDEAVRMDRPSPDSLDAYEGIRADQFEETTSALTAGRAGVGPHGRGHVAALMHAIGLSVAPESPAWDTSAFKATEGLNTALRDIRKRMEGDYVPTPMAPNMPAEFRPSPAPPQRDGRSGDHQGPHPAQGNGPHAESRVAWT